MRPALIISTFLLGCATQQAATTNALPPPPAAPVPVSCPTTAPVGAAFAPESVFKARVEKVCLVGAGDETSLRLREAVASREGAKLDEAGVQADLSDLFATGLIRQATAFAERSGPDAVVLTYVVVERPLISAVRLVGGSSLPADLRQRLEGKNFRDTPFQRTQRRELAEEFYDDHGFPEATIDLRTEGSELVVTINEGQRVVVDGVRFEGAKAVSAKELEKVIETRAGEPMLPGRVETDVLRLVTAFYDRGYAMATVEQRQDAKGTNGAVTVVFTIVEGPQFRVGNVTFTGFALPEDVRTTLETKRGKVFSRAAVQRDLARLKERAHQQGKEVEVVPLTKLDQDKRTIGLTFEVAEQR